MMRHAVAEKIMMRSLALSALALALLGCQTTPPPAAKRDYIVTGAKPDHLFVIDAASRSVASDIRIPDANGWVGSVATSTDGKMAYVLVNRMESVAGIDLTTGKQVFRADLSQGNEKVKSFFAINVTPDGKELIVYELPTKMELNEYKVQEPRFAVFDTSAGLQAKPVRVFPAPRRVHMILPKKDGKSFYALGFQLYEFDIATGKKLGERGVRDWNRPDYGVPDVLAFWPVTEPTGTFATPAYAMKGEGKSAVQRTSLMTLDLNTGALNYQDFEDTVALIFSTVVSPVKGEAFGVYTQLTKIDTNKGALAKRVDLAHTFYTVNVSTDGKEVFLGGTMCDISFHDPDTLQQRANLKLPGCPDQSISTMRVVRR
jgi:quinohemoprotein amine dehydrogenase beta subunit